MIHLKNIKGQGVSQHTGESTAYVDFKSSSFMRFLPMPVLAVDSVADSSGKFWCCCCSSTLGLPTSAEYKN